MLWIQNPALKLEKGNEDFNITKLFMACIILMFSKTNTKLYTGILFSTGLYLLG